MKQEDSNTGKKEFVFPMSFQQEQLWFIQEFNPTTPAYNIPFTFHLSGRVDGTLIEKSLLALCRRHEVLRTSFSLVDDKPSQVISENFSFRLQIEEFSGTLSSAKGRVEDFVRQPFDLKRAPLLKGLLLKLSEEESILSICSHHIIVDGWSQGILLNELGELYNSFLANREARLEPLELQYADFVVWQRDETTIAELSQQLEFWRDYLSGKEIEPLNLPTDFPRPAHQSFQGDFCPIEIPAELVLKLKEVAKQEKVTLYMLLLAALNVLFYRYGGQEDILIASPVANRKDEELEKLIGYFVNTVVFRNKVSGDLSFGEFLQAVAKSTLAVMENDEVSFERIVAELQPKRDVARNPLFQVMFSLQTMPQSEASFSGLELEPISLGTKTAKFDLLFELSELEGGFKGFLEFNTDIFSKETAERIGTHFLKILEEVSRNPGQQIRAIDILPAAEQKKILIDWNQTSSEYPAHSAIHHLFEKQVESRADETALVAGETRVTYRELDTKANRLAHFIRARGVDLEVPVGLFFERNIDMVVAMFAVLKAGGAYVALDPLYPRDRLALIIEDAQLPLVLSQSSLEEELPGGSLEVVCLDKVRSELEQESAHKPDTAVTADNLAYVFYTSGSTGRPKGVAVPHRGPVALTSWAGRVFTPEELSGVLFSTTICFDLSVFELFSTLGLGGKVILAENALALPELPNAAEVVLLNTVPSAAGELVAVGGIPPSVKVVTLCGEPLSSKLSDELYQQAGVEKVFDLYGPSEDTTYSTYALRKPGGPATIGKPIDNTQAYVLDSYLQVVPIGVPGELYLAGDGLARGYLNRQDLTEERFIPNPFSDLPAARMYKTGDSVRYGSDGNLEFFGRLDFQVKVRGYRIELGEIESVLRAYPILNDAVVTAIDYGPGDKRLVAYLVLNAGEEEPTGTELRNFLAEKLPDYMVPPVFVTLEAFPRTPNGKIDRKALPKPQMFVSSERAEIIPPRSETEIDLAEIWKRLLELEEVGLADNFFDLGGHSLLSLRVIYEIENTFGVKLNPRELVLQNLAQLASLVELEKSAVNEQNGQVEKSGLGKRLLGAVKGVIQKN